MLSVGTVYGGGLVTGPGFCQPPVANRIGPLRAFINEQLSLPVFFHITLCFLIMKVLFNIRSGTVRPVWWYPATVTISTARRPPANEQQAGRGFSPTRVPLKSVGGITASVPDVVVVAHRGGQRVVKQTGLVIGHSE